MRTDPSIMQDIKIERIRLRNDFETLFPYALGVTNENTLTVDLQDLFDCFDLDILKELYTYLCDEYAVKN